MYYKLKNVARALFKSTFCEIKFKLRYWPVWQNLEVLNARWYKTTVDVYTQTISINTTSILVLYYFRAIVEKKVKAFDETSFGELRRLNDQMIKVERAFIYSYGLPGRRLVRHVIFAPSKYNLYGTSSFPGVSDILFKLEETGNEAEVDRQISIARQAILAAVDILTPY